MAGVDGALADLDQFAAAHLVAHYVFDRVLALPGTTGHDIEPQTVDQRQQRDGAESIVGAR